MSLSKRDAQARLFARLYPVKDGPAVPDGDVDLKKFALIILLSTHSDVFASTLPAGGGIKPDLLRKEWFSATEIPDRVLEALAPFRSAFAEVQQAWYTISDYEDPPCPTNEKFHALVDYIKSRL